MSPGSSIDQHTWATPSLPPSSGRISVSGSRVDAEPPLIERRHRLAKPRPAAVGRVLVGVGQRHLALGLCHHHVGSGQVGVADAERDHVDAGSLALGDLSLQLGEQVRREILDALGEPHLERLQLGHEQWIKGACRARARPGRSCGCSAASSISITSVPPSVCTVTGEATSPAVTAATAAAVEPLPDESVSPAPRSHTRMRMSFGPSGR